MPHPQFNKRPCRPRDHLTQAAKLYPNAWADADRYRAGRGHEYPDWPDWCYLPITATATIVADDAGVLVTDLPRAFPARLADAARLAALCAWRMTQGIYRFDETLGADVVSTPVAGDIPHEILYRLPEWCVYVETPGLQAYGVPLHGFFAHLEHDIQTHRPELRLLLDGDAMLQPQPIHLGPWSLAESIARTADLSGVHLVSLGLQHPGAEVRAEWRTICEPLVSLLIYLCTQTDFTRRGQPGQPTNPAPTKTRRGGWKLFPAQGPTEWDVGVRMGAALRTAYHAAETGQGGTHAGPRGHIRRAHWHTFVSGPRKSADGADIPAELRPRDVRWMPPIPVNLPDIDGLPATIRGVK